MQLYIYYETFMNHGILTPSYKDIYTYEKLYGAYKKARTSRRGRAEVMLFDERREWNLGALSYQLQHYTYHHGPYREFVVHDSKKRLIKAAPFRDRIVHRAVVDAIEPLFERRFIYDSYVCRVGKGSHRAVARLRQFMYEATNRYTREAYFLKLDVAKYFPSIDHGILFELLSCVVTDASIKELLFDIIESSADAVVSGRRKGVPIGNLTSQLFANVYLNELDHYAKEQVHCRYYIRYMDDVIVCSPDIHELSRIRHALEQFLRERLLLTVHPHKVMVGCITSKVPFLGYVLFLHHTRLRASTVRRCSKRIERYRKAFITDDMSLEKIIQSYMGWHGYAVHANTQKITRRLWRAFW